ncbi:hypothetical protein DFA_00121 [Cavenderia fasciculata]|uniref:Uncharacterized protein n=1 Tax=Cavenderia fasciculata TaxID=261658 RepID=F4PXN3_CACFS|nr:uncharacterized protein DFA_00121 [Cavenderia fasciculata]EGG19543.1 hypothetical protein DFA_00121 [Cavenderia fasciculata]|eukprot:XP_004357837.1 hypothetical protein DFA_00121 [Cavenderia fasciculata]
MTVLEPKKSISDQLKDYNATKDNISGVKKQNGQYKEFDVEKAKKQDLEKEARKAQDRKKSCLLFCIGFLFILPWSINYCLHNRSKDKVARVLAKVSLGLFGIFATLFVICLTCLIVYLTGFNDPNRA